MPYRLLVSIEVIEFIERLPTKTREALRLAIRSMGRGPWGGPMRWTATPPADEYRSR
jgi:hypothetical protein